MQEKSQIEKVQRDVQIPIAEHVSISADLTIPTGVRAIVLFAHGSGSSRFSPRNRRVAETLQERHLATILIDLLTPDEEAVDTITHNLRFDIKMLAKRVVTATHWLRQMDETKDMTIGYFGASTGAAAALVAAAELGDMVSAVVSRGGRPDLAQSALDRVQSPTLLVVGGNDSAVIDLNRQSLERLKGPKRMVLVSGAGHLFELPGMLERVAELAGCWFEKYLPVPQAAGRA